MARKFLLLVFALINFSYTVKGHKIIGGSSVSINQFPYQLSLSYGGYHICGAVLISKQFALTGAHCIYDFDDKNEYSIRAGSNYSFAGGVVNNLKNYFIHKKYNPSTVDYDLAILQLSQPFNYTNSIQPIKIATNLPNDGCMSIVSGWGATFEGGALTQYLMAVTVPIINKNVCRAIYYDAITPRMFCAGNLRYGGKDSCQGDSGGPIVSNGKLVGTVSWGMGCGRFLAPGVYTNIPQLLDFIGQIVIFDD